MLNKVGKNVKSLVVETKDVIEINMAAHEALNGATDEVKQKMKEFLTLKKSEGPSGAFKMMLGDDLKEKIFQQRKKLEMTEAEA